jgi:hypothetical protein
VKKVEDGDLSSPPFSSENAANKRIPGYSEMLYAVKNRETFEQSFSVLVDMA